MQPAWTVIPVLVIAAAGYSDAGCPAGPAGCGAMELEDKTSLVQASMYLSRNGPKASSGDGDTVVDSNLGLNIANILTGKDEGMPVIPPQPQAQPAVIQPPPPPAVAQPPPAVVQPPPQPAIQVASPELLAKNPNLQQQAAARHAAYQAALQRARQFAAAHPVNRVPTETNSLEAGATETESGSAVPQAKQVHRKLKKQKVSKKMKKRMSKVLNVADAFVVQRAKADELTKKAAKALVKAEKSAVSDDDLDEDADINEEFLDLQAETGDAQLAEVEDAKDTGKLSEFGCLNGGSSCDDASSEPEDPFDAPSSESIGVLSSGAIDIPSVLYSSEQRAISIVEELEREKSFQLAHREDARDEYRSARKANEREFQDKVLALNQEHADSKKALRARVHQAVANAEQAHVADWVKRQVRSSIRTNMTQDRVKARENRQTAKRRLRAERRSQQTLIDKVFKDSMGSYNRFSRKLMKARFTRNILPKVRKMMTANVQHSLTLLDLAGGNEEEHAAAAIVRDQGFKGIQDVPSMRFYITQRARSEVKPLLEHHFKKLRTDLWAKLGTMKSKMKTSLVSTVGGVPHVGQTVSAVVPNTVDDVYAVIKHAVNTSLNHVCDNMATKLTESIANPIMDIVTPKLRSGESLDNVVLPKSEELADFTRQSKLLQTRAVIANWGNGLKHAQAEAKNQESELLKDAYDEAKLALADIRADNDLSVEVLDAQ